MKGQPGRLGEASSTWTPRLLDVPCSNYPVSSQGVRRAELIAVKATREIYLDQVHLDPLTTRLRIGGVDYHCRDVREWRGVTAVLAEEVA